MKVETFAAEAEVEAGHWWFVGRRHLFASEIARAGVSHGGRVLDLGTSTGTNLRMLREQGFADVAGLDASDEAIRWCAEKGLGHVVKGDIVSLPFPDGHASLVLATDVIEHVDDDAKAVAEIARVLRPGGVALFSVPAFAFLWGLQDEVAHHKRRYRKPELEAMIRAAGLAVERSFYFNYLLLPPIWLARQLMRIRRPDVQSENDINAPLINRLLLVIFRIDVATAPFLHPPAGVSAFVLARKPA